MPKSSNTPTSGDEPRFLREADVRRRTGLSRTTRWRLERDGKFPPRRQLSANTVAWWSTEIDAWCQSRVAQAVMPPGAPDIPALAAVVGATEAAVPKRGGSGRRKARRPEETKPVRQGQP
ncbi:MAG: helix-turn-helix transcriptional regulator [Stellaceae bacterium]